MDREAGFGLVETLVTVAIVSIGVVMVVGGMSSSLAFSTVHRETTDVSAVLVAAAEKVKAAAYVSCPPVMASPYQPYIDAARLAPRSADFDVTVTGVQYWDGSAFGAACNQNDTDTHPLTLQLVTLRVASKDGRASDTVAVVKGKQAA